MSNSGYEATMKLAKEHPEAVDDLKTLLSLTVRLGGAGLIAGEETELAGIPEESMKLFEEYGIIRKRGGGSD